MFPDYPTMLAHTSQVPDADDLVTSAREVPGGWAFQMAVLE
jgi:hypothetical protein